jgi:APA family basic amino acid/polyamine antiporter
MSPHITPFARGGRSRDRDHDPGRNLPRGALGGLACTIVLYLLVNVALLHVLGLRALAESSLPAAAAAQVLFGGKGGAIITALALASLLSVINAVLMLGTRILFAVARDGLFVEQAAVVSRSGTPVTAMLMTTGAAFALVLSGTFEQLVAVASVLYVGIYASGFLALIALRRREPDLPRPFRVPGYPWTPILMLVVSAAFLVASIAGDPRSSAIAVGLLAAGYAAYRLLARRRGRRRA